MSDVEYSRLSFEVGLFCGKADAYLQRQHFSVKARAAAWDLTPELFREFQREARDLGVPEEMTALTPEDERMAPAVIATGKILQKEEDRRSVQ